MVIVVMDYGRNMPSNRLVDILDDEKKINIETVTINKLMEIAPSGTVDPTSGLYNTTMYLMAVVLFVALIMNATMRPVDAKHHMKE